MYKYLLFILPVIVNAGPYIEVGLGVPLLPETGYTPDQYGIAAFGYNHHLDKIASVDIGFMHRSLTGSDNCHNDNCYGDNTIEAKLRFEW